MKLAITTIAMVLALNACASTRMNGDEKLALYREHASAPVSSFDFSGKLMGWTALGDQAIAVWTRPNEAFLLDLSGPCRDIEYGYAIGLTSNINRVSAKFDKVLVSSPGSTMEMPCRIEQISPLDTKRIKQAEKLARDDQVPSAGASETGT